MGFVVSAAAQLEILSGEQAQAVFGGEAREIQIVFRNRGERTIETSLKTRLFQLSSATRMPVGEVEAWKKLTVLGGQTVIETARLKFPGVRATTPFEARWLDDADKTVGQTLITVYPTNLLKQFADIVREKPAGIFDPHEQITPLLRALKVEFDDLTEGERLATWRGRLAILGPFDPKQPPPREMQKRATALAAHGVNVLLLSPQPRRAELDLRAPTVLHSAVVIRAVGTGRVVTATSDLVARLDTQPLAQEKLLELARLAVAPNLPLIETDP